MLPEEERPYVVVSSLSLPSNYASVLVGNDAVVACSGGKRIHLLSRENELTPTGTLRGHKINVEDICTFDNDSARLASCGADKCAKIWDIRQQTCVQNWELEAEPQCIATCNEHFVAVAAEEKIHLWDVRKNEREVFVFTQVHTDVINTLQAHPLKPSILISAGDDQLVCQVDTTRLDDDDGVAWVVNSEDTVRHVGIIGDNKNHGVITVSTTDEIRVWSQQCSQLGGPFTAIREAKSLKVEECGGYVVTLFNEEERAYVLGGSNEGKLGLFHLNLDSLDLAHPFTVTDSSQGHRGVVRSALRLGAGVLLTADENGKLITWGIRH